MKKYIGFILAGGIAGVVNGLFGAGGGMVLVPFLSRYTNLKEQQIFPCSVSIILPICIVSVCTGIERNGLPLHEGWPYLIGGAFGGFLASVLGHHIPAKYLHRILGILILWGGIRYIC